MNKSIVDFTFVSCRGQHDNLGDLVLRRTALRWIEEVGQTPAALVAGLPKGFVDGLQLGPGTVRFDSTWSWLIALLQGWRVTPVNILYAPGPQSLQLSVKNAARAVLNGLLATLIYARNGRIVKVGRSIESSSYLMRILERVIGRRAALYTVRDQQSVDLLALPTVRIAPDLAWGASFESYFDQQVMSVPRHRFSMCFRSDRAFNQSVVRDLARRARERGLTPTLVTQVRRDNEFHRQLALELNCEHREWFAQTPDDDQLRSVLQTYRESEAVVSNRLHSVIFGVIAGAIPIGLATPGDTKLRRTLAVVGLQDRVFDMNASVPPEAFNQVDCSGVVADARRCLDRDLERFAASATYGVRDATSRP